MEAAIVAAKMESNSDCGDNCSVQVGFSGLNRLSPDCASSKEMVINARCNISRLLMESEGIKIVGID